MCAFAGVPDIDICFVSWIFLVVICLMYAMRMLGVLVVLAVMLADFVADDGLLVPVSPSHL